MNNNSLVRQLNFDLASMQLQACIGVRRAAVFLGVAERFLEGKFPTSLSLGKNVIRQFVPDPYPPELQDELRENWQAWIIGNALRELDQFLSLFLDEAYDMVQQAKIVSKEQPPNFQWKGIGRQTNVADKHKTVLSACGEFAGVHLEHHTCLASLSNARNCLAHDRGIVTPKRVNANGTLVIQWLSLRTIIKQGESEIDFESVESPFATDPNGPDAFIAIKNEIATREFAVWELIRFSSDELAAICFFYQTVIDLICSVVETHCRKCGVVFSDLLNTTASPSHQ